MFSDWPSYPQVYVDGEFIGGCDTTMEMYKSGVRAARKCQHHGHPCRCREPPHGVLRCAMAGNSEELAGFSLDC